MRAAVAVWLCLLALFCTIQAVPLDSIVQEALVGIRG